MKSVVTEHLNEALYFIVNFYFAPLYSVSIVVLCFSVFSNYVVRYSLVFVVNQVLPFPSADCLIFFVF